MVSNEMTSLCVEEVKEKTVERLIVVASTLRISVCCFIRSSFSCPWAQGQGE